MKYTFIFIVLLVLSGSVLSQEQEKTKIRLVQADIFESKAAAEGESVNICIGGVIFEHDSAYLYCDTAYIYGETNSLDAYGNVYIILKDSTRLWGDSLKYSGDTKVARVYENVILIDSTTTLYTDYLVFNRNIHQGYYPNHGRIVDSVNTLTSIIGYYYTEQNRFFFKDSVVVTNPDFVMNSDTLLYNTESKIISFLGPTHIVGETNYLYCEDGWYNTVDKYSELKEEVLLRDGSQIIVCDSLHYNKVLESVDLFENIVMRDTLEQVVITGNYGEYRKIERYAFVVDSAQMIMVDDPDSLFMHADTLYASFDSLDKIEHVLGYHGVRIFKKDLQGRCDSISYSFSDSILRMYQEPILWSINNQMTSDSIFLYTGAESADSIKLYQQAFIISKDSTTSYNQIKGRVITGYFEEQELRRITVVGNAESLYFMRSEQDKELIGIDKAVSSWLYIEVENQEFSRIVYLDDASAKTYPEAELPENARLLRGFLWLDHLRPRSREDIFKADLPPPPTN